MNKKQAEERVMLSARPLRIDIDTEYDVFRRLDRKEVPPALSRALAESSLITISTATWVLRAGSQQIQQKGGGLF